MMPQWDSSRKLRTSIIDESENGVRHQSVNGSIPAFTESLELNGDVKSRNPSGLIVKVNRFMAVPLRRKCRP